MKMRYTLFQTGPDNHSTYPDWLSLGRDGRLLIEGQKLADLMTAVDALDHDNFWIRGPGGKRVAGSRKEFYQIPAIRNVRS